jgi:hypothetical protein
MLGLVGYLDNAKVLGGLGFREIELFYLALLAELA